MEAQVTWKIAFTCVLQPQGLSTFNDAAELGAQEPVLESFYANVKD